MHFADPIAIIFSRILVLSMANRAMRPSRGFHLVIRGGFVTLKHRPWFSFGFHCRLESDLSGIVANGQADFTGLPANHALNRRTVVGHHATPTPLVSPSAGRIGGIRMWITLFTLILEHLIPFGDGIR